MSIRYNNSDIPESKFAKVTIGNNGIRIVQEEIISVDKNRSMIKDHTIYISKEDLKAIYNTIFSDIDTAGTIEVMDTATTVKEEKESDQIIDANY